MKLTIESLKDKAAWEAANIALPSYDVAEVVERAKKDPVWVHFGIGNIFRIFLGGIADRLLNEGYMDKGITCVESFVPPETSDSPSVSVSDFHGDIPRRSDKARSQ